MDGWDVGPRPCLGVDRREPLRLARSFLGQRRERPGQTSRYTGFQQGVGSDESAFALLHRLKLPAPGRQFGGPVAGCFQRPVVVARTPAQQRWVLRSDRGWQTRFLQVAGGTVSDRGRGGRADQPLAVRSGPRSPRHFLPGFPTGAGSVGSPRARPFAAGSSDSGRDRSDRSRRCPSWVRSNP